MNEDFTIVPLFQAFGRLLVSLPRTGTKVLDNGKEYFPSKATKKGFDYGRRSFLE
jgi:hypothetical protein